MKRIITGGFIMGFSFLMILSPPGDDTILAFSIIEVIGLWLLLWGVKTRKKA